MDEAFMSRVAERIAAATESVSSFSPAADPENLAAVQTMDEWMASHSPGMKSRCADCRAPLVGGSRKICLACGSLLPPGVAVRRESFTFGKSLTKKLLYESLHLEDPHDTSSDDIELELQPTSSGTKTITNGYLPQQPPPTPRPGAETDESSLQGDERSKAIVSDASDSSIPPPAHSESNKPLKEEEDEEYIWGSSDADDFGLQAWAQQLAPDSGGDPKEFASADHSAALYSANQTLGQTLSTSDANFFVAASISPDQTLSQSVETDFNFFFPSAPNSVHHPGGEQLASTTGPQFSNDLPGPSVGTGFHDFFQASHPASGDQSLDPKVQTPDPSFRQASAGTTVGDNFDAFFQAVSKSADRPHLRDEKTGIPFSGEVSSNHSIETDFDDFFQAVPKSVDHPLGLNVDKNAEGTRDHKIETDFDNFFNAPSGLEEYSGGLNLETPIPHITEESSGQDGEADFEDFLQAAPRSANHLGGSNQEKAIPHLGEDLSSEREETFFDFFSNTSSESANHGPKVEAATALGSLHNTVIQRVESDFDFFFQPVSVSGDQSRRQNGKTGPPHPAEKSIGQDVNYFDDFFQGGDKPGDHKQNVELLFPISVDKNSSQLFRTDYDEFQAVPVSADPPRGLQVDTPVTLTVDGSNGEADFDDFFQAAPVPAGHSGGHNTDGADPNSVQGSSGGHIETDFDDFFDAAPKSVNGGSGGHNGGTDFDYVFQTPQKSEGRLPVLYAQPGVPDNLVKSNGEVIEADFDFFQGANISINHSDGRTVKTVTPNPAEASVDRNGRTGFPDFFQAASYSVSESNGHNAITSFDFFKDAPHSVKEVSGQNLSTGFDDFFSTPSNSVGNGQGKSEKRDFDDFFKASPSSMVESLEQSKTTDSGNGEFDDFVQAAPRSADKAVSSSHTAEFDFFFHGTPRPANISQRQLTDNFDDFFQVAPQASDEFSNVEKRQVDFLKASNQFTDDTRSKKGSTNVEDFLLHVAPPRTEATKSLSSSPGSLVQGNGFGASPTSALTEARSSNGSSNGDVLKQLQGLQLSPSPSEPSREMPNELSDLSFRLADHLVISDHSATNLWSLN